VVEVAVAADDGLDVGGMPVEPAQVLDASVRGDPGVEEQTVDVGALAHLDQRREAVLRQGSVGCAAAVDGRRLELRPTGAEGCPEPEAGGRALVDQEHVDAVVTDGHDLQLLDRLERQHLAVPFGVGGHGLDRRDVRVA
jgi:hypothetical protein